ncbi:MAG: alpha-2-macroglobulin, partial [Ignavibacteria bacterium]|nr:alpha-2-macroglobulin [Ignavibacteria bacterium]
VWLLKNKQTNDWKTTKATVEAIYALMLRGDDWLATEDLVDITVGTEKIDLSKTSDIQTQAGTGYFTKTWKWGEIKNEMGNVTVSRKSNTGISWGALYWQYFENLDKITKSETNLKIDKKLFLEQNTASGPVITPVESGTALKPGDMIKVRIEIRVDRDMEYVHMKDMRAAGFEPVNVISQYKYKDGLGYYESTRDAATNFFFGFMPKGTYVFEYPLRVNLPGDYSNGITSIQCMYAPEFTSHSEGVRVRIER